MGRIHNTQLKQAVYFIPEHEGAEEALETLMELFDLLAPYCQGEDEIQASVVPVKMTGGKFEGRTAASVKAESVKAFQAQFGDIHKKAAALAKRDKAPQERTVNGLMEDLLKLNVTVGVYQKALSDNLDALEVIQAMARNAVNAAQVKAYGKK